MMAEAGHWNMFLLRLGTSPGPFPYSIKCCHCPCVSVCLALKCTHGSDPFLPDTWGLLRPLSALPSTMRLLLAHVSVTNTLTEHPPWPAQTREGDESCPASLLSLPCYCYAMYLLKQRADGHPQRGGLHQFFRKLFGASEKSPR